MVDPAPDSKQLEVILTAAARVPDHGRTVPFYFIVFESREQRSKAGALVRKAYEAQNPEAPEEKLREESQRFLRAPLVVAVIYRRRKAKHPAWEQMLSVGAACQNLLHAAHAEGFAAQWLTEWYAYDENFRASLGLDERDMIAGFIHIGTPPATAPEERERPDLSKIVTHWTEDQPLKKGDEYDQEKFDFPRFGFEHFL